MAYSKKNVMLRGFSGTVGKVLTFSQRFGKTVIGEVRKRSDLPPSEEQLAIRERFLVATRYARRVMDDAARKLVYESKRMQPGQTAYNLAVRDAFKAPVVHSVNSSGYTGQAGQTIDIKASDDFKVNKASISIHDSHGDLLESGEAIFNEDTQLWVYTATVSNASIAGSKITATAYDLPGNTGVLEVVL